MIINPEYLATLEEPVQCTHCGGLYDLATIDTEGEWETPCCGTQVNPESGPAFNRLEKPTT